MARKPSHGRPPSEDYFRNLKDMGAARELPLSDGNGHLCDDCGKPAVVCLVFAHESVNLCADAYKKWKAENRKESL